MNKKSVYFLVKLCLYFISHLFDLDMPDRSERERERGCVCVCVWGGVVTSVAGCIDKNQRG